MPVDRRYNLDALESKLFGLGSESYVVGSHEFYLGYAITKGIWLCLDSGHFHPTEVISDKLSSVLMVVPGVVLHISRAVRWDSDHVVTLNDEVMKKHLSPVDPGYFAPTTDWDKERSADRLHQGGGSLWHRCGPARELGHRRRDGVDERVGVEDGLHLALGQDQHRRILDGGRRPVNRRPGRRFPRKGYGGAPARHRCMGPAPPGPS